MIPATQALFICVSFLWGLGETALAHRQHCAGDWCFILFREPQNFTGARRSCEERDARLLTKAPEEPENLAILLNGLIGSYWLDLRDTDGRMQAAAGLQNCSSISVSAAGNLTLTRKPCGDQLDGFLCHYKSDELCGPLQVGGGEQVSYIKPINFEVDSSEGFLHGTTAITKKTGADYPESKHICIIRNWWKAPWTCEGMNGGCEHKCDSEKKTCVCPAGHILQSNNFSCTLDLCSDCAPLCKPEGDSNVCKCGQGYRLAQDGKSCVAVKCEEKDPCTGKDEECSDTPEGPQCTCKNGFDKEDGMCVDKEICLKCEHMRCDKHNGVYKCSCRNGFRVSAKDPTKCEQHCTESDCLAQCIPNSGVNKDMHHCFCPAGYIKDIRNNTAFCTDINECEIKKQCDHKCENLLGSFRCLCNKGFKLHRNYMCLPITDGSHLPPPYPTSAKTSPATVPSYIKTGSVLGITVFMVLFAALLFFLAQNMVKRCGKFELPSFRHPDIDIFHLQQVTTETYKRLSSDKQSKNDSQIM